MKIKCLIIFLAPTTPSPVASNADRPVTSAIPARRPMTHSQSQNSLPQHSQNANLGPRKQQIPLHLAASTSSTNSSSPEIPPKPVPRSSFNSKSKPSQVEGSFSSQSNEGNSPNNNGGNIQGVRGLPPRSSVQSQSVSQMIPHRLSEGSSRTASLTRVGTRSQSQSSDRQPLLPNQSSGSRNQMQQQQNNSINQYVSGGSNSNSGSPSRNSYERSNRTGHINSSSSFRELNSDTRTPYTNGYAADYSAPAGNHRRSGSSPVSMTPNTPVTSPNYRNSTFFDPPATDDDQDGRILYL